MAFLSSFSTNKTLLIDERPSEPTHAFCAHFDPLHGSTLDILMSAQGLVYDPKACSKSTDPAMQLMHKLTTNLQYTVIVAGMHSQVSDICYAYHQGCFALFCYRGETGDKASRDAIMFSVGVLFEYGDMLLFLERGLIESKCIALIKAACEKIYTLLVGLRNNGAINVSPQALGSDLRDIVESLLNARLLMRPQTFLPRRTLELSEHFNEATLAVARVGLLLGLRVGIAVHSPVHSIIDLLGNILMLGITKTIEDQTMVSLPFAKASPTSVKITKATKATKISSPRKGQRDYNLQHSRSASSFTATDYDSKACITAPGDLLSDTSDNIEKRPEYILLPRLLGHVELHSLKMAQQAKINKPFLFLDPTEGCPERIVRKGPTGPLESKVDSISYVTMFNYLWSDVSSTVTPQESDSVSIRTKIQPLNIAFNGVVGISTEIAQLHELFDIVLLTSPAQVRQLQLTPSLIHPYLIKTRLANIYISSKIVTRYEFLVKRKLQGSLVDSMSQLCLLQGSGDNIPFLICSLNTRLYTNIKERLEQRRKLTVECFKGTGLSGGSDLLLCLARYWFTDKYRDIGIRRKCPCI